MIANSADGGDFYTILPIICHPWQPLVLLHMEYHIYYSIGIVGKFWDKSPCVPEFTMIMIKKNSFEIHLFKHIVGDLTWIAEL